MKKLLIALVIFSASIGSTFSQVNVLFTQNNQFQVWNDSVFNSDGYYCNTNLIAYHDFTIPNGDVITKWVWIFNGSTNYDTVVMTPQNYQMHVWVYYPNSPGSYQTTLTVYALDSCNTEYSSSVAVTVNLGFVAINGNTYYQKTPWDSATLKVYGNYGPGTFVWSRNDTIIGQTSNSDSSQITVNQFGYYVVNYQNASGCEVEDWILVDILPPTGTFCAQLAVGDSANLGGGYFCNQDSLILYDMSWLYTTGQIYHWRWRIKSADDQTVVQQFDFDQSNYQPNFWVYFPDSAAVYRVELAVSSYAGPTSTVNVGVHLGFADVIASSDVSILPGDSVNLSAYTNHGPGNFIWYKNGNFLGYTLNSSFSTLTVSDTGTYLVVYHNNGCDALDEVKVSYQLTTSISEVTNEDMRVFPNPATSQFTILASEKGQIEVFSLSGQLVHSGSLDQETTISCLDWQPGAYFVRLTTLRGKTVTKKLLKQ